MTNNDFCREVFADDEMALRPAGSEVVAAVFVGDRPQYSYDMVFYPRQVTDNDAPYMRVHEASPMLDVMLYPLIHLHAEESFLTARRRANANDPNPDQPESSVGTLRQYYSVRLMTREGSPGGDGVLFQCRGLYQQWLCDAALKIMDNNLRYIESQQETLTACHYDSLQRFVESEAARVGKRPGRVVILPRSQQHSERRMYSNYMDAVRISMEFGAPTWFLTLTTNPSWEEVKALMRARGLGEGEYMHACDAVVRAYLSRCNVLLSDVVHECVLGLTEAYVGVHEFTTSGLPHFHVALMMNASDRPSAEQIDAFISAEIPSLEDDPKLQALVLAMMVHRPCDGTSPGYDNPPCRPDGGPCRHGFPKAFNEQGTYIGGRGPVLRRRDLPSVWHPKFRCPIDNRWVVDYLIKELIRLKAHICGMACGENMFWKYMFGYMQKSSTGHHVQGSMLSFAHREAGDGDELNWDEVEQCQSMRMVGPFEAVFHILGQPITVMSHRVVSLDVHLPDQQYVYYRGDFTRAAAIREKSKLLAWFKLNQRDPSLSEMMYVDVMKRFR